MLPTVAKISWWGGGGVEGPVGVVDAQFFIYRRSLAYKHILVGMSANIVLEVCSTQEVFEKIILLKV